jgi:hypothetical protein
MAFGSNDKLVGAFRFVNRIPETVELKTYQTWRSQGYQVKKGEHSKYSTMLWVCGKFKKEMPQPESGETTENPNPEEMRKKGFVLKKCFFFTQEQVEKIKSNN